MQASDENEMNEWIALINYAGAFKTAGVRMRVSTMRKDQAVLAGAAAAASHQREIRGSGSLDFSGVKKAFGEVSSAVIESNGEKPTRVEKVGGNVAVDVDGANDVAVAEGDQLEEVFDVVKADLAAGRGGATRIPPASTPVNATEVPKDESTPSRGDAIQVSRVSFPLVDLTVPQLHITALGHNADKVERQLNLSIHIARNLAILTPFQKSTRDRITGAIPALALRIRQDRLQLAKLRCEISILREDLDHEQRDWATLRHVALQSATKSLRSPSGVSGIVQEVDSADDNAVPKLALPISEPEGGSRQGTSTREIPAVRRHVSDGPHRRPSLPRYASANSGPSQRDRPTLRHSSSDMLSGHLPSRSESPNLTPNFGGEESPAPHSTLVPLQISDMPQHDLSHAPRTSTHAQESGGEEADAQTKATREEGEEAEEWQNTRAARRVSLAAIPMSDIRELSLRRKGRKEGQEQSLNGENEPSEL